MHYMNPTILHLDEKWRLSIPTKSRSVFAKKICHLSLRTHSILLSSNPLGWIWAYQVELDKSGKILIWKDLLTILGVTIYEDDSQKNEAIWLPYSVNDSIQFLVFFGDEWRETWRTILTTKTAVNQLHLA